MENVTPATSLLEKRRQMFEVQEQLEVQKAEFNRREEGLRKREDALKKKDLELQESLVKFSKFLQENDSKWTRAEKKATDEIRSRLQKEEEIRVLSKALDDLRQQQLLASNLVENSLRYQKYLEQVSGLGGGGGRGRGREPGGWRAPGGPGITTSPPALTSLPRRLPATRFSRSRRSTTRSGIFWIGTPRWRRPTTTSGSSRRRPPTRTSRRGQSCRPTAK